MGNYTSKLFWYDNDHETKSKSQSNSDSCGAEKIRAATPPATRKLTDPRSATIGISRTPIQVNSTPTALNQRIVSAVPKYLQGKRYLETDIDAAMMANTPEKCLPDPRSPNVSQTRTPIIVKSNSDYSSSPVSSNQAPNVCVKNKPLVTTLDPRSPATDFDRTPILKSRSPERELNSEESDIPPVENKKENIKLFYCETTTDQNIPEIQTVCESISGIPEYPAVEKGFNDNSNDLPSNDSVEQSDCSEIEEQITVIKNPKVSSSYSDPLPVWTEDENERKIVGDDVVERANEIDELLGKTLDSDISEIANVLIKKTIEEQKTSSTDKIKVWRDSISPSIKEEYTIGAQRSEIIIDFDETISNNPIGPNLPITASKIDDDKSKNQKKKKPLSQSKDENKADERKFCNVETKNSVDPSMCRTPLANRSNNQKHIMLATAKSPQQLLRNKGLSTKLLQQENTPPAERLISKTKPHGIQWDPDTTVII